MVWIKRLIVGAGVIVITIAAWLWLTMLSPWFYERPSDLPPIEPRTHHVFVYGTLRYDLVRWIVIGASGKPQNALLEGFERHGLDLTPNDDAQVKGLLLEVTPTQLSHLDRYERLGVRYERIQQTLADGTIAWVYVRLPTLTQLRNTTPDKQVALVP